LRLPGSWRIADMTRISDHPKERFICRVFRRLSLYIRARTADTRLPPMQTSLSQQERGLTVGLEPTRSLLRFARGSTRPLGRRSSETVDGSKRASSSRMLCVRALWRHAPTHGAAQHGLPKKPLRVSKRAVFAEIGMGSRNVEKKRQARGTQSRRVCQHQLRASPLKARMTRLWHTFQPVPIEGRSILIGVGPAATSAGITRERGPREAAPRA
jgi:hypothetical protein